MLVVSQWVSLLFGASDSARALGVCFIPCASLLGTRRRRKQKLKNTLVDEVRSSGEERDRRPVPRRLGRSSRRRNRGENEASRQWTRKRPSTDGRERAP